MPEFLTPELLALVAIGFTAQVVDGALGMAFGVVSTSAMLALGMPPAQASAIVHTAEIFTTGESAASHIYHRNVDWRLVARLGIAGVIGAVLGAWVLSNLDAGAVRPYVSVYLFAIAIFILFKAMHKTPTRDAPAVWVPPASGSPPDFSMPAAEAGGGRSRPRRLSDRVMCRERRLVRSIQRNSLSPSLPPPRSLSTLGASPIPSLIALVTGWHHRCAIRRLAGQAHSGARDDGPCRPAASGARRVAARTHVQARLIRAGTRSAYRPAANPRSSAAASA